MDTKRSRIPKDAYTSGYNTGLLALGRDCNPYMWHSKRWWEWSQGYFAGRSLISSLNQIRNRTE